MGDNIDMGFYQRECNGMKWMQLEDGAIGCRETSINIYLYSLRNNPEERSSHLLRSSCDNEPHYVTFTAPLLWESDTGSH